MIPPQMQQYPSNLAAMIKAGIGAILLLVAGAVFACSGRVVGVTDGDTIKVLCDRTEVKVRLAEIDAPERGQPFGAQSKAALSDLVFGRQIRLDVTDTDRYGRSIARVWVGRTDANREMVRLGYAWAYRKYLTDATLLDDEAAAQRARSGLWADANPSPPWEFRAQKRKKPNSGG
ncbi:MAG: thermonuclease family protein [Gammaproteobacteria bacterium]|nr:thermonuclease family protein [Gammaproteobacteria bacterium]